MRRSNEKRDQQSPITDKVSFISVTKIDFEKTSPGLVQANTLKRPDDAHHRYT